MRQLDHPGTVPLTSKPWGKLYGAPVSALTKRVAKCLYSRALNCYDNNTNTKITKPSLAG